MVHARCHGLGHHEAHAGGPEVLLRGRRRHRPHRGGGRGGAGRLAHVVGQPLLAARPADDALCFRVHMVGGVPAHDDRHAHRHAVVDHHNGDHNDRVKDDDDDGDDNSDIVVDDIVHNVVVDGHIDDQDGHRYSDRHDDVVDHSDNVVVDWHSNGDQDHVHHGHDDSYLNVFGHDDGDDHDDHEHHPVAHRGEVHATGHAAGRRASGVLQRDGGGPDLENELEREQGGHGDLVARGQGGKHHRGLCGLGGAAERDHLHPHPGQRLESPGGAEI
mmetsp:Transcript_12685/g.36417  ORF Transcript_12685/g.36417 Transcript_12685/m.36417 type:complete len:273 (+) Transcript_12685:248-1066(+)